MHKKKSANRDRLTDRNFEIMFFVVSTNFYITRFVSLYRIEVNHNHAKNENLYDNFAYTAKLALIIRRCYHLIW